jgi:hypothetical protein
MVVYYSYGGSTRIYAEILAELLGDEIFELRERSPRTGFFGKISGAFEAIIGVSGPLESLPDIPVGKAVFICSPIWAGTYPPAVSEFFKKCGLQRRKVNVVLTCGNILKRDAYKKKTLRTLQPLGCTIGFVQVFICDSKLAPDRITVRRHLKKLVLNVDEAF